MSSTTRRPHWAIPTVLAAAVLWTVYLAFFGPGSGPADFGPPPLVPPSRPASFDYRWPLTDRDGRPFDPETLRGRAVFLNLWATWCPPCRAELPSIANLSQDPRLKDVAFVLVSTEGDPAIVRDFVAKDAALTKAPIAFLIADDAPEVFLTQGIPATFVLDPKGNVVLAHVGAARWDDPTVVDFLASVAAKSGASPLRSDATGE